MSDIPFEPDEIGPWSEIKLEIIEKYGPAYTQAFSGKGRGLKKFYIDGFSGAGLHLSKSTKATIAGSPARALKVNPPFDGFFFIDLNKDKTDYLRKQCEGRANVDIFTGDCNGDPPDLIKQDNDTIAEAFRQRLFKVAGFAYVPEPLPMKNRNNAVLYYLFFAAASKTADKIIRGIFGKYR